MSGNTWSQVSVVQKARKRWWKNETYVLETPFSSVYFSPFLHSLNVWIIAFSLKPLGEGGFGVVFGSVLLLIVLNSRLIGTYGKLELSVWCTQL